MQPEYRSSGGTIDRPEPFDWPFFLRWTAREGWRVPSWELALYRKESAGSAFVWRDATPVPLGFVTVCRHQNSAWIGNLIVDPQCRGKGVGRRLFHCAIDYLSGRGVATVWLTASADGQPLYESCGFREIGHIERWVWQGEATLAGSIHPPAAGDLERLVQADAAAWGDCRGGLLSKLACSGQMLSANATMALLQGDSELRVLGPWLSTDLCPRSNRMILATAMDLCAGCKELTVDLMGGSPVRTLLSASGFRQTGGTVLMVRGEPGPVKFGEIVALASLGSMG